MNEVTVGIIGLLALLCLFLTGIELAFAMTVIGFVGFASLNSFGTAVHLLANDYIDSLGSYGLTAIPLFVFMGQIAFNAGIAKRLYDSVTNSLATSPGDLLSLRWWAQQFSSQSAVPWWLRRLLLQA